MIMTTADDRENIVGRSTYWHISYYLQAARAVPYGFTVSTRRIITISLHREINSYCVHVTCKAVDFLTSYVVACTSPELDAVTLNNGRASHRK
jgi:hypothetical protein